jgi:hypothetical protein
MTALERLRPRARSNSGFHNPVRKFDRYKITILIGPADGTAPSLRVRPGAGTPVRSAAKGGNRRFSVHFDLAASGSKIVKHPIPFME